MTEDYDPIAFEPETGLQGLLGYRLEEWSDGVAVVVLDIRPEHLNRSGVMHGGVTGTLIDSACGYAVSYCPYPGRIRRAVTLSLTTSFIGQVRGGLVRATARCTGGGRRILAASAEIAGADGALVATGQGTFRLRSGSEGPQGEPV